ncbi:nuclear transport factor 2 family protein [Kribbella sp. NPDC050241]|uniref:nuclear transport factor 2 family protein n=1 Tax=Kribbella sp. NPDC050241 TaxID=3364115 RepID=UPI0037A9CD38
MTETTDRWEIQDLFTRLARVLDEGTPEDIGLVYTKDVLVRSPRAGELQGIDAVIEFLRGSAVDGELAQHFHSDILVSIDGDRAEVSANQLTFLYREGEAPHQQAGLRLKYRAVRTDEGWRFAEAKISRAWVQQG